MFEPVAQIQMCKTLAKHFPKWNFIGFYDTDSAKDQNKIYIGQYVTETIVPVPEIEFGKG